MKIILATQGSQGVVALRELFALGYKPDDISVVICNADPRHNEPLISFLQFNDMKIQIASAGLDLDSHILKLNITSFLLLSISWKFLISEALINKCNGSAINFHPGLLPQYRGCFSTSWSIINGESVVGYTYHLINQRFDEGPILFQEEIEILEFDTAHSLNYRIMQRGLSRLGEVIKSFQSGSKSHPQDQKGKYYPNQLPYKGEIDSSWDIATRNRFIRAIYFPPYKPAFEMVNLKKVYYIPQREKFE